MAGAVILSKVGWEEPVEAFFFTLAPSKKTTLSLGRLSMRAVFCGRLIAN